MKTMIARTLASLAIVLSLAVPPALAQEQNIEAAVRDIGEFIGEHGSTEYECGSITYDVQVSLTYLTLIYTNRYDDRCDRYCRRGYVDKVKYEVNWGTFTGDDHFSWESYFPFDESECGYRSCLVVVPYETRETTLESPMDEDVIGKSEIDYAAEVYFYGSKRHQDAKVLYDKLYYLRTIQQSPRPQIQEVYSTVQEARSTGCSVTDHESALFDLTDPILDLTDATADAEDAYAQLVQNADPGLGHRTEVVVSDLERLIGELFAAGSKLDRNNLDHLSGLERAEREVSDFCIDDHYRASRVASSCADELREYRRVIRSLTILAEDMLLVIANAENAGGDITINASTLWPTREVKTQVRDEDLDSTNRLIREAKHIRRQLEKEVRAQRHPRKALYSCIRQTPSY